ncbi:hypothetical protein L1887_38785 [Cichorium endivia]|nr:hypothetical protein L1887_38785 [Cichorium endivia]
MLTSKEVPQLSTRDPCCLLSRPRTHTETPFFTVGSNNEKTRRDKESGFTTAATEKEGNKREERNKVHVFTRVSIVRILTNCNKFAENNVSGNGVLHEHSSLDEWLIDYSCR